MLWSMTLRTVQALRAIAALLVVLFHCLQPRIAGAAKGGFLLLLSQEAPTVALCPDKRP